MPLTFITHNGIQYPEHEAIGGASVWIRPLAQHYCKGIGLDIGYSKEKWMLPGAIGIEPDIDHTYHAMHLPKGEFDYLHSSHCLEHVKENWPNVVDYWLSKIKVGGILFLYLPHKSQSYWNVTSNRKHVHEFKPSMFRKYLRSLGHKVWVSGCDFNHSFVVVCEKYEKPTFDLNYTVKYNPYDQVTDNLKSHEAVDDYLRSDSFQNLSLNNKRELLGFAPITA